MKKEKEQPKQEKTNRNQHLYDIFVSQGILLAAPAAEGLKESQGADPISALGDALYEIVHTVETEGAKNGVNFDLPILANGVQEILQVLLDMSGMQVDETDRKSVV